MRKGSINFSELEIELILLYIKKSGVEIKVRESEECQVFHVILYTYPRQNPEPSIVLPRRYWGRCYAEERMPGKHPENGRWSTGNPYSYMELRNYMEASREQLTTYFAERIDRKY